MRVERDAPPGGPLVKGFAAGGFRVGEEVYAALLMTAEWAQGWTPPPLAELDRASLAAILAPAPEFVLLGTGVTLARPPRTLVAALEAEGIGLEPMDSRAAARAWSVLRNEGRQVAAAFYPFA